VFLGLIVGVARSGSPLRRFDEWIAAAVARRRSDLVDRFVGPLSMLAAAEPLTVQGAVAFAMIFVTIGDRPALRFAVAAVGGGALTQSIKGIVKRERPAVPHLLSWLRGSSFPSGDLLNATCIYLTIALETAPHLADETARSVLFGVLSAVLVILACARVYAGVHYPTDVAAGIVAGAAWALAVSAVLA
jgi:undecaprenyl-diphosphatase